MFYQDIVMRVGGEGGEGVISTGEMIAMTAARMGLEIYTFRTYPAEIKGGYAMYQIRLAPQVLLSQGDKLDVLVAFNQEAYDASIRDLKETGVLLYDRDLCSPESIPSAHFYGIPVNQIANDILKNKRTKNILFFGICSALFGLSLESCEEILRKKFMSKGQTILEFNIKALRYGFHYVKENINKKDPYLLGKKTVTEEKCVLSGNEALALGAIAAGIKLYAGYPITPATDIMEFLAEELPKFGGTVVQAEDEIAAVGMVIGASFGGVKAMTATSGPGFSLMTEFVGLASMAEMPTVIVNVQRGGPSTGMPTKTEQGDLNHAVFGGHSDAPRIVIGLTSVEDCFYGILRAFNYSEKYQIPVIVLSDQYLGHRKATIPRPDVSKIKIEKRLLPALTGDSVYERFKITESGISPLAIPAMPGVYYTATGIEHDEYGEPKYSPENHLAMMQKRFRKLEGLKREPLHDLVRRYGSVDPEIGVMGWGSSEGVIREAVSEANRLGYKVAALHTKLLSPLPEEPIADFIKGLKAVIVPELNFSGQFAGLLRRRFKAEFIQVNKVGGLPFMPREILEKIEEVSFSHSLT